MIQIGADTLHDDAKGIDLLPPADAAARLLDAQVTALATLRPALPDIVAGSAAMARVIRGAGRLVYGGAGSSALMAAADAMELAGTFGIAPVRIAVLMAGGLPTGANLPGETEDDAAAAATAAAALSPQDLLIAVSASGRTPYAVALAETAKAQGAEVIAIANRADAPLFAAANIRIALLTPPELVAGSTRMSAGTAQKAALNLMSTLMGIALGHVFDGMMVNLRPDNAKLRARAINVVSAIAGVPAEIAAQHLAAADFAVKPATLLAAGAGDLNAAETALAATDGRLRDALAQVTSKT